MEIDPELATTESQKKDAETEVAKNYSTAVSEEDKDDFAAIFEEDSDDNLELWRGLVGNQASLPKKGDLVVYFPQGHLEYAALIASSSSTEIPTFNLQPQIICRVQHVQLIVNKSNDEACAHVTLLPEPEANTKNDETCTDVTLLPEQELVGQNPKGKEVIESGINEAKDRRKPAKSASYVISKTLFNFRPNNDLEALLLPEAALQVLLSSDYKKPGSHHEVVAQDLQGTQWIFQIDQYDARFMKLQKEYKLSGGWKNFVRGKRLKLRDKVVFARCRDTKLRLGIRRYGCQCGVPESIVTKHYRCSDILSPVADAILNKSMFHVYYCPRVGPIGFIISYQKYMESITRPVMIGTKTKRGDSLKRRSGVVTGISELDPFKWPNSKWKCLMISQDIDDVADDKEPEIQVVSPWEIICTIPSSSTTDFAPKLKKPRTSQQHSSPTNIDPGSQIMFSDILEETLEASLPIEEVLQYIESGDLGTYTFEDFPGDLGIDRHSSSASLIKPKSTPIMPTHLKISKRPDQEIPLDPMVHNSLKYLEFDSCLFHSPTRLRYFPVTLKVFKITNCINSEHILALLMDQKGLSLESLKVDGCDSLVSLPIDKLPATLRELKILNCLNLKSLAESLEIEKHDSAGFCPSAGSNLPTVILTRILELRKLVISDCEELEFLPEGLHNLIHLELLSISNCSSLVTFPEGGLPKNCLTTLTIHGCGNLMTLPSRLHELTSLRDLSVCHCPCLMSLPEGGLPPNLVSLCITDCKNLILLSHWGLHKLKHLRKYRFIV